MFSPEITRYDTDIETLQELLTSASSQRAALQEYSDGCRSVFAPVRRLPTEILAEILSACAPEPILFFGSSPGEPPTNNFERLAQMHLVTLSQVCSSWRTSVMGPPSLWATIDGDLSWREGSPAAFSAKITHLMSLSLQRSGNYPLTIHLRARGESAGPALKLLAQHSARWRAVDFHLLPPAFGFLSLAKGNLPLLECLEIGGHHLNRVDIFEAAPKLREVAMTDSGPCYPQIPWNQLRYFTFEYWDDACDINDALRTLLRCSSDCYSKLYHLNVTDYALPISDLVPVRSDVSSLQLTMLDDSGAQHSRQALGAILTTLTLPNLRALYLGPASGGAPLHWPRDDFARFAAQSTFRYTLTELHLYYELVITHDDLVECLLETPALLHLYIADVLSQVPGGANHLLITDRLLQQLTWTSDPACLVPNLNSVSFASFLTFDDHVLLAFVNSRLTPGRNGKWMFQLELLWHPTTPDGRDLDASVAARLSELEDQDLLAWSCQAIT
ncbi:hypothetical protein DFH09DRAFT_1489404 [Mycena vulgaris]|nr:hypothetical protein DFH09DRAFT_1489404 [Mycena vulgaris]